MNKWMRVIVAYLRIFAIIVLASPLAGCGVTAVSRSESDPATSTAGLRLEVSVTPPASPTGTQTLRPTLTPTREAGLPATPPATPAQPPPPTMTLMPESTLAPTVTETSLPQAGVSESTPVDQAEPAQDAPATSQPVGADPEPEQPAGETRTVRVGLHGRNDADFHELDYQLVREANIETLKMMSLTRPEVFARLKQENPELEFIVRLYDDRINENGHPSPEAFAERMIPLMKALQPYVTKFEVGNEPNHYRRYEGWGPEDADAENFKQWFLQTYELLKAAQPWAELGFPALGTPDSVHRDRAWLEINREAIERADWLGVHCYWQTQPDGATTMFDEAHGLCFKYYHAMFPQKPIELTEFDNDNVVFDIPPLSEEAIAQEHLAYYQELFKYPYLRSASSFIMSSPDSQNWAYFVWRTEDGRFKPVVGAVGSMPRPLLVK